MTATSDPASDLAGLRRRVADLEGAERDRAELLVENARLRSELHESHRTATASLEQQTVTAEVLRVIASSPTDLASVLSTIAERACRLCDADDASVLRVNGESLAIDARFQATGDAYDVSAPGSAYRSLAAI